jgi:ABC-type uncharacterized transport system fused permease/ATPase subunit
VGGLIHDIKAMRADHQRTVDGLSTGSEEGGDKVDGGGKIVDGDVIAFDDVTIRTPAGVTLCTGLTFGVAAQQHLIVCGPNGAGKSSTPSLRPRCHH